jgi:glycosyltransferase involved in cell wall biosynthesis
MPLPSGMCCYLLKRFPQLTQTLVAAKLRELERQGARLTVVGRSGPSGPTAYAATRLMVSGLHAPVRYLSGPAAVAGSAGADAEIARYVVGQGATHLHAHFTGWAAHTARRVSAATGIGYSITAHASDLDPNRVDNLGLVELLSNARFVVTVTEDSRRHVERLLDAHGRHARIIRLHPGVDLTRLHAIGSHREPGLVVGVGRLVENQRHDVLIEAIRLLHRSGQNVRCVIVGDGPLRARLERQIDEAGLNGLVKLLAGRQHETVPHLLR